MASPVEPKKGRLATLIARFVQDRGADLSETAGQRTDPLLGRTRQGDGWDETLADPLTTVGLGGTPNRPIRSVMQIMEKWQDMLADPVISTALRLHVTAALGGHEAKGEMVFIEANPNATPAQKKLVEAIASDLQELFNRVAPSLCFNACGFGRSHARVYSKKGVGVQDLYIGELVYPPLVQPYERGNRIIGYSVASGSTSTERLSVLQMATMRLPTMVYLPQSRIMEKAARTSLMTDDIDALPALPSSAGGSFLDGAEEAYNKFSAAWAGLVGQRVQESIDERFIAVQQSGMTKDAKERLKKSLSEMFAKVNAYIKRVVSSGKPVFERLVHFIPVHSEKQMTEIAGAQGQGRQGTLTVDDVMMHARFLSGALGVDLSMLGFSDQLAGGLGDGGAFRTSAHAAERSRMIRVALTEFFDHVIELHLLFKDQIEVAKGEKFWSVNYYSGISALEKERTQTKADAINGASVMVQVFSQLVDIGMEEKAIVEFLKAEMAMDEKAAVMHAKSLIAASKAKKEAEAANGFGGGGGFGRPTEPLDPDGDAVTPPDGGG